MRGSVGLKIIINHLRELYLKDSTDTISKYIVMACEKKLVAEPENCEIYYMYLKYIVI